MLQKTSFHSDAQKHPTVITYLRLFSLSYHAMQKKIFYANEQKHPTITMYHRLVNQSLLVNWFWNGILYAIMKLLVLESGICMCNPMLFNTSAADTLEGGSLSSIPALLIPWRVGHCLQYQSHWYPGGWVSVFHEEEFQLQAPSQQREIAGSVIICVCFLYAFSATRVDS